MKTQTGDIEEAHVEASAFESLARALLWLDDLLARAAREAETAYGPEAGADAYRGLYIDPREVARLLARAPGSGALHLNADAATQPRIFDDEGPLGRLRRTFGLSSFDLRVMLIALAPELDLRYERLFAYLQDDVTRKRPGVSLALDLLCGSPEEKLMRRAHFAPDAPLARHGLLALVPDANHTHPPLLAHYMKLHESVVGCLLGQHGLDERLVPFCQLVSPGGTRAASALGDELNSALAAVVAESCRSLEPLHLYLHGARGAGRRRVVEALALENGLKVLVADLSQAPADEASFRQAVKLLFRDAALHGAILYLDKAEALGRDGSEHARRILAKALGESKGGITVISGDRAPDASWREAAGGAAGLLAVEFATPDFGVRRACWRQGAEEAGGLLDASDLDALAWRFRFTPGRIAEAVAAARRDARWRAALASSSRASLDDARPTAGELFAAARALSGHDLGALARRIEPKYEWQDIVLPPDQLTQLKEICDQARHRHLVFEEWGFDRKLSTGRGLSVLFSGPPGTGKTMSAEVIARELHLDLYKIDLSSVVSKYIGETEKNLNRVFDAAESADAVLFFDEADALFGKRSEVQDAHDRYANIETAYLLQKMEEYEGVAVLATNLRQNLDEAFMRRLSFIVHFPQPDGDSRRRIWSGMWPPQTPLAEDVDLDRLARQFKLSGGNIKNIVLAAAFLAAEERGPVSMRHLLRAVQREYRKLGRALPEAELARLGATCEAAGARDSSA